MEDAPDELWRGALFRGGDSDSDWTMQSEPESVQELYLHDTPRVRPFNHELLRSEASTTPSTGYCPLGNPDDNVPSSSKRLRTRLSGVKEAKGWSPVLPRKYVGHDDELQAADTISWKPDLLPEDNDEADDDELKDWVVQRRTKNIARGRWITDWIRAKSNARGYFKKNTTYPMKRYWARQEWNKMSEKERFGFYELAAEQIEQWDEAGYDLSSRRPPQPMAKVDSRVGGEHGTHTKVYGLLCTYNYTFPTCDGLERAFKELQSQDPGSDRFENAVSEFQKHPVVVSEWKKWLAELQDLVATKREIGETSACAEISVKSNQVRVHYHTFNSSLSKRGESIQSLGWDEWEIYDRAPDMQRSGGRGRYITQAIHRGHTYCQATKIGHLFTYTNYPMYEAFRVNPKWLMDLWADRKMSTKELESALIATRGDGLERHFQRLAFWSLKAEEHRIRELQRHVKRELEATMLPFKRYPEIAEWGEQYLPNNFGKQRRFKFLVLEGPTSLGKTVLGMHLFKNTFYVNMQCTTEPNLIKFRYGDHDSILLDEISWQKVISHKVFFQAGVEGAFLSESVCMQHAYWRWLYAIPLILCTNRWIPRKRSDAKVQSGDSPGDIHHHDDPSSDSEEVLYERERLSAKDRDWLEHNSVHVRIKDKVWESHQA